MADRWQQFNYIIDNSDLNIKEKGLLLILFRYINHRKRYADPSRVLIKKLYGTQKNDVLDKTMNSLIEKGWVIRERFSGKNSRYYINVPPTNGVGTQIVLGTDIEPSTKTELGVGTDIEPGVGTQIEPQKEKKRKEKENIYMDLKFIDDVIDKVNITQEQYDKLINKFNKNIVHRNIIDLDNYIANGKGGKYKDHYRALNTWCNKNNNQAAKKEAAATVMPIVNETDIDVV